MAVDDDGTIHVVWGQMRADSTSGDDGEIYWVKSTDEGSTWSSPARVNQDSTTNDQWLPWLSWDDCTNALVVVFFDSRNDNARAETYVAVNYLDEGLGWIETKVSDMSWSGDSSPTIGRAGDYIGVAARDGIAYPVWSDDREAEDDSTFKVYASPIYLWGVDQSSVQRTIVSNGPGLELTVRANWTTNLEATGTDSFVLMSPTNVVYTGTATGSGTSHEVTKTCTCETGDWNYIVKSTRPGFTTRGSDVKTFKVNVCLD
jgi:hypothetical protein